MNEQDIIELIKEDKWMMDALRAAESLNLPDWWIGAGFVRSKVWDHLHGYKKRTPLPDIDLIYFDKDEIDPRTSESQHKVILAIKKHDVKWQVKNQARMHIYHKRTPYKNSQEALSEWAETATCIGVRLEKGKIILTAPYGIGDLISLILRPIPNYDQKYKHNVDMFEKRLKEKCWLEKWPKLKILK